MSTRTGRRAGDPIPFTASWVQRFGYGEKRAREIVRWLVAHRYLEEVGSYRSKRHGYRVPLYRVRRSPWLRSSVGKAARVKSWWQHSLFGSGTKDYPRSLPKRLRTWKEPPLREETR